MLRFCPSAPFGGGGGIDISILELRLVETLDPRGGIFLNEGGIGTSDKSLQNLLSRLCEGLGLWIFS